MTSEAYLSRATLRHDSSATHLLAVLRGQSGAEHAGHHLVWSLFADSPDRRRDFLWREAKQGTLMLLSARKPVDRHNLFRIDEPKVFTPMLNKGDRLVFSLRANPVVRRRDCKGRSAKHDVVIDALRHHRSGCRAKHRLQMVREQGFAWLASQGKRAGFSVEQENVNIDGYQQHQVERKGAARMLFSTLDMEGVLSVCDPSLFVAAVLRGFGSAKAYGCGLMLIRRA